MKQRKYLVAAISFFLLLLGFDLVQQYWYLERSLERLDRCIARIEEKKESSEPCSAINAAADAAYSSATSTHTLTTLVLFSFFVTVGNRLDKAEERIADLESRFNV